MSESRVSGLQTCTTRLTFDQTQFPFLTGNHVMKCQYYWSQIICLQNQQLKESFDPDRKTPYGEIFSLGQHLG